jgi:hypothetical protein
LGKSVRKILFEDPATIKLELLNTPINKLQLDINSNGLKSSKERLFKDFESAGIKYFRPRVYLSNETGCDDGTGDIGIIFIEADPYLEKLYEMVFGIKPSSEEDMLWTFRHEAGHSFMWKFQIHKTREFRRLFGNISQPYGGWKAYNHSEYLTDNTSYVSGYAQTHPIEDFAETFRIFLESEWNKKYKKGAVEKLKYIQKLVEKYGRKRVKPETSGFYQPVEKIDITVAEFLESRENRQITEWNKKDTIKSIKELQESLIKKAKGYMDDDLLKMFTPKKVLAPNQLIEQYVRVADWFSVQKSREDDLQEKISYWTGAEIKLIRDLVDKFLIRVDILDLTFKRRDERKMFSELSIYLTTITMNYLYKGEFYVK